MQSDLGPRPEQKICGSCGQAFGCGAKLEGCWCTEVEVAEEALAVLKEQFDDCLCGGCLTKLGAQGKADKSRQE